ncbi:MAG: dipeptidyl aminopeptidase/acylaminoacyl peptidase [Enterobacterales bacterium]|jgi:dipeptidyl aminopeptidase/acylaminoacyl peptidase
MKIFKTFLVTLLVLFLSQDLQAKAKDIPVEAFFNNPDYTSLQLSPSGKYLAVISPVNKRRNLVILETKNLKNARALTGYNDSNVGGFFWANDDSIIFTMDTSGGREAFSLYKVNAHGEPKVRNLVDATFGASGVTSASVVNTLPNDPDHIIVQFNGRKVREPDLYKLEVDSRWNPNARRNKNKGMKLIAKNPGDVQSWLVDHDGDVRGALSLEGLKTKFFYKDKGEKDFRMLKESNVLDEGFSPLGFDFNNEVLYVASNIGRDTSAIYPYDPNTDKMGEMIYGRDDVDMGGMIFSRKRNKLLGVTYFDDYPHQVIFDKEEKKLRDSLDKAFDGKEVSFTSQSEDEMMSIVHVGNDRDPGQYYLFDRTTNKLRWLLPVMSSIDDKLMSPMKPIEFVSRDGLTIHGYVTIPKDSNGKMLPLILNPHGGPFGVRDRWGFNTEHQFFASRGYATVQVNYRGSGGYGRKFEQAGYGGKWGAEMQHDLTDAVKYLIKEGIADADKVCIYGGSYGGYATMAGLTFTPDLYKCGINYVGVTDVALLFDSMPKAWEPAKELMKVQIGDPEDKELMHRMSPLSHVDKIKAPLMIVHGAQDPRVVKQHAIDLRDELESRDITLNDDEWIMKKDEGHGFRKEENRIELYKKMEKFLAKHLN